MMDRRGVVIEGELFWRRRKEVKRGDERRKLLIEEVVAVFHAMTITIIYK